jgi:hypothetical protein
MSTPPRPTIVRAAAPSTSSVGRAADARDAAGQRIGRQSGGAEQRRHDVVVNEIQRMLVREPEWDNPERRQRKEQQGVQRQQAVDRTEHADGRGESEPPFDALKLGPGEPAVALLHHGCCFKCHFRLQSLPETHHVRRTTTGPAGRGEPLAG